VLPTPFPVGPVNCYLACDSPVTLIDTGTRWDVSQQTLCEELKELGMTLCDIERIIITHPHPDHYGLAAEIVRQSGSKVWAHRHSGSYLSPSAESRENRNLFYRQLFSEAGVPELQIQQFFESRSESGPYTEPVETDHTLDEGDQVQLGSSQWSVYHTPGHSGGLVCLYDAEQRVLLANDHILRSISSNPIVEPDADGGPRPHRLVQYLYHLRRMAALEPRVVWTGHGAEIHDVGRVVRQRIRFHERRANHVLGLLSHQQMTAHQVTVDIFGSRTGFDSFLALSETMGHLDWLLEQGRIRAHQRGDVIYWASLSGSANSDGLDERYPMG